MDNSNFYDSQKFIQIWRQNFGPETKISVAGSSNHKNCNFHSHFFASAEKASLCQFNETAWDGGGL